ncbi:MAG: 3-deoxy-D-manno-octulosonic acid transferase [Bernardetiaceae bacterium]
MIWTILIASLVEVSRFFYRVGLWVYGALLTLAQWFIPKARLFVQGRRGWRMHLRAALGDRSKDVRPLVWMHCASLGEFEQGRSLLEALRAERPEGRLLLTFFSPSGYQVRKGYPVVDAVAYLPLDTPQNARDFIEIVRPDVVVFVKYEFWYFYLMVLQERRVPVMALSAIFREDQHFFRWYGRWHREALRSFAHFFVQNQLSADLLGGIGIEQVSVSGDTRLDRVLEIRRSAEPLPEIAAFVGDAPALVVGSAWPQDLRALRAAIAWLLEKGWRVVVAPHEVDAASVARLEALLLAPARRLSGEAKPEAKILILDRMGWLSRVYAYAALAYIGGGFGRGLHNTMEAAVYGIPVLFGDQNYMKFQEAQDLVALGGGFALSGSEDLLACVQRLVQDANLCREVGQVAGRYVEQHGGATRAALACCLGYLG